MKNIMLVTLLGSDLKSRSLVADILLYVKNVGESEVCIDFSNVKFVTRSFIDEFYNTFVNDRGKLEGINVRLINIPDDIQYMLNVVSRTQTGKKLYEDPANTTIKSFNTVNGLSSWMHSLRI